MIMKKGGRMMEYSIHQLSELAGVSTRTLRWYHEKELLCPSRIGHGGYRYYNQQSVDRLQQILFYRALGVELARIRELLDDPAFHRLTALKGHLTALQKKRARIQRIIRAVEETISKEERGEIMDDKAKFEAFKRNLMVENEEKYGAELREAYGDELVEQANSRMLSLDRGEYEQGKALEREILDALTAAVLAGMDPRTEAGKSIVQKHRTWLELTTGACRSEMHRNLGALYVADTRFTQYYDRETPGCAAFLHKAILHWVT